MCSSLPNLVSGLLFQLYRLLFSPSCLMRQPHRSIHPSLPPILLRSRGFHCPHHIEQTSCCHSLPLEPFKSSYHISFIFGHPAPTTAWLCSCEGKRPTFAKCLCQALREAQSWKTPTQSSWEQSLCPKTDLDSPHPLLFHFVAMELRDQWMTFPDLHFPHLESGNIKIRPSRTTQRTKGENYCMERA